jgi:hypothetical protein
VKPLLAIYNVDTKMSDDEFRKLIVSGFGLCQLGQPPLLSVDGYGDDPRDLWEIPEAVNLAKRMVSLGVCSVLHVSTTLDPKYAETGVEGRPFGAFEVWMLAKGKLGEPLDRPTLISLVDEFRTFLTEVSNKVATEIAEGRLSDGQHKGTLRLPS